MERFRGYEPVDCRAYRASGEAARDHAENRRTGATGGTYKWWYCALGPGASAPTWQRQPKGPDGDAYAAWLARTGRLGLRGFGAEAAAVAPAPAPVPSAPVASSGELATTMVLRGAVGTLIGAAAAPKGREGIWGAAGFVLGVTLGQMGIVAIATAALWKKVDR